MPLQLSPLTLWALLTLAGCDHSADATQHDDGAQPAGAITSSAATSSATAPPSRSASASVETAAAPAKPVACAPACNSIEQCQAGRCMPACPSGEVFVPATSADGFTMGKGLHKDSDTPHQVVLTRPFCMDATEVTVRAYQQCVQAGGCKKPRPWGVWLNYPAKQHHPLNKVHWHDAKTYCAFRKQSLPSEAQWEWAAGGGDGRQWPWGNDPPSCKHADYTSGFQDGPASDDGCHGGGTSPVASHPLGDRSWPDGVLHDLGGNVWEWCLDNFRHYERQAQTDPIHLDEERGVHVVRGGGWNRSGRGILVHYRGGAIADYQVPALGFRCVRNPE